MRATCTDYLILLDLITLIIYVRIVRNSCTVPSTTQSLGSSVSTVPRLWAGQPSFHSRQGQTRPAAHSASYPCATAVLSPGVKWQKFEAGHSHSSRVKFQNAWGYNSSAPYVFMAWCLVNHRDNFKGRS
jgi:hypothetical protein